jgi:2'-5' RNA ligase
MRLFAAVLPPRSAVLELADLVGSVASGTAELNPVPADAMMMPITNFGNVAQRDAVLLLEELEKESARWPAGVLHFAGGTALEWRGDENVWAKVGGDVDALNGVGRSVPPVVQRLGFFVDRRAFRPWLAVGSITDHTTAPYLEKLVAALDSFQGQPWPLDKVHVMRRLPADPDGGGGGVEIVQPLGLDTGDE